MALKGQSDVGGKAAAIKTWRVGARRRRPGAQQYPGPYPRRIHGPQHSFCGLGVHKQEGLKYIQSPLPL